MINILLVEDDEVDAINVRREFKKRFRSILKSDRVVYLQFIYRYMSIRIVVVRMIIKREYLDRSTKIELTLKYS